MRTLIVLSLVIGSASCGSSTPAGPSIINIAGTWTGSMTDVNQGPSTVSLTITQSGTDLSGSWTLTYPDTNFNNLATLANLNHGTLSGSINGSAVSPLLTPTAPNACFYGVSATVNGSSIVGTWNKNVGCTVQDSGTLTITKQ